MIKAEEAVRNAQPQEETVECEQGSRVDILAHALGLEYRNGQFVKMRRRSRAVPSRAHTGTRGPRRAYISTLFYDDVRNLDAGEEMDATALCTKMRMSVKTLSSRLNSWQWQEKRRRNANVSYSARVVGGRILVRREV